MSSQITPSTTRLPFARRITIQFVAFARVHRRITMFAVIIVMVLVALEIGVRVVTPDTMEMTVTETGPTHNTVFHRITTDPKTIASTYQALTKTPAPWADISGYFKNPDSPMYSPVRTCQFGDVMTGQPSSVTDLWVIRFLWHGLPVAVITHYNAYDNPYALWTCVGGAEWQVSAGGIVNPRPYVDDSILQLFPEPRSQ